MLGHAGVDALVAAAGEDQGVGAGQVLGGALGEDLTRGGGDDEDLPVTGRGFGSEHVVKGIAPHVGLHHHAGAASQGRVVDGAVPVMGVVTQVVDA